MATELLANNFAVQQTGNGGAINAAATTVNVSAAAPSALQGGQFRVKWLDGTGEIGLVTAGQTGTDWTITRGVEGTTASSHTDGATIAHILTAAGLQNGVSLPSSVVLDSQLGLFPLANYSGLQAAVTACNAAGGGVVQLPAGGTALPATLTMASKVKIRGAPMEWAVDGETSIATSWLEATGSTGAAIEFPSGTSSASVEDVLIMGNGQQAISVDASAARGGNRLRNVYVYGGGTASSPAVYIGTLETRMEDLLILNSVGDGLWIDAQDCGMEGGNAVGNSGGNGVVLTANSGPLVLGGSLDTFDNTGDGLQINGSGHRLSIVQSNNNANRNLAFLTATSTVIIHYTGGNASQAGTGLYPDVEFAHPTGGNQGCGIIGGQISCTDGKALYGAHNAEHTVSYPMLIGIGFNGTFSSGNSATSNVSSINNFQMRGCNPMPDVLMQESGEPGAIFHSTGSSADQVHGLNSANTANAWGFKNNGAGYLPLVAATLSVNGAVTFDSSSGNTFVETLSANATSSSISNATTGEEIVIMWRQDGTGGRTYSWPSNCKFAAGTAPTASTTAGYTDAVTFVYDGTNWIETGRSVGVH